MNTSKKTGGLAARHCPADGTGVTRIDDSKIGEWLGQIDHWRHENGEIRKVFKFKDFYQTMGFVNAVAFIANQENHHPDLEVSYNQCVVRFSTHSVKGLSENDFICAAKVDALGAV